MSENTFNELKRQPIKDKSVIGTRPVLPPIKILETYGFEDFEDFILEWASVFLLPGYHVVKRGGAGDMGIDILVSDENSNHIFYQCKKYSTPFTLPDTITEIGKICYYSYIGEIPKPTEYYLVALSGLNHPCEQFFLEKNEIKNKIIEQWDVCCKNKITTTKKIELTKELEEYIKNFNFNGFNFKGISEILNEHQRTVYFAFRFGEKLTIDRPIVTMPLSIQNIENIYIKKLYEVYTEMLGVNITTDEELKANDKKLYEHFQIQRERFFSAENLRLFARDSLLLENEYVKLKEEIYSAIVESLYRRNISSYDRLSECLSKAASVAVTDNLLTKCEIVSVKDRQGICHHLANEKENVTWRQ